MADFGPDGAARACAKSATSPSVTISRNRLTIWGDVGVVHGGPDAGNTISGFFDSDVDVRHNPLQDSLKNIVRQRWEITCKPQEGNLGSEFRRALERPVCPAELPDQWTVSLGS